MAVKIMETKTGEVIKRSLRNIRTVGVSQPPVNSLQCLKTKQGHKKEQNSFHNVQR